METKSQLRWLPLSELERWPRNPKKHDIPSIKDSLRRFGFVETPVKDERTGRLVAGHGRQEALSEMRAAGEDPPSNIQVRRDGEWLVPVLCGVSFRDDREAEAYIIASNRLVERGGWDELLVQDIVSTEGFDALGTGLSLEMPEGFPTELDTSGMDPTPPSADEPEKPRMRTMRVGKWQVPMTEDEKTALEAEIMSYEETEGGLEGFVSHLLGRDA